MQIIDSHPETLRQLGLDILLNKSGVCPMPQVAIGVTVVPVDSTDQSLAVCVLNLHLKSNAQSIASAFFGQDLDREFPSRVKQAQLRLFIEQGFASIDASIPLVICGDLNQTPSPDDFQKLRLVDSHSSVPRQGRPPIDFILAQDREELTVCEILSMPGLDHCRIPNESYPSDHVALAACIGFNQLVNSTRQLDAPLHSDGRDGVKHESLSELDDAQRLRNKGKGGKGKGKGEKGKAVPNTA